MDEQNFNGYRISGYSDDSVMLYGHGLAEQLGYLGFNRFIIGHTEAAPGEFAEGVIVDIRYGDEGASVWTTSIRQLDEELEIPWEVRVEAKLSGPRRRNVGDLYSPTVVVLCPPGTPVVAMAKRKEIDTWETVQSWFTDKT